MHYQLDFESIFNRRRRDLTPRSTENLYPRTLPASARNIPHHTNIPNQLFQRFFSKNLAASARYTLHHTNIPNRLFRGFAKTSPPTELFRLNQIKKNTKSILTNIVSYDTLFVQTVIITNGGIPMNQTDNAIKYLASCFLFEGIPPTAAERCLRNCELSVRDYRSGDIICSPAEGVGGLKTVLSGRAVVT